MKRNLERRVEVITPIIDETLRKQLREIMDLQLADRRSAWDMQPDGSYIQRQPAEISQIRSCQDISIERSAERLAAARKQYKKQLATKTIAKRKNK